MPEILQHLPDWGWQVWAIGLLLITLVFALEGSYRLYTKERQRAEDLSVDTIRELNQIPASKELEAARRTIENLQAKISALEDIQPRLRAEAIMVQRKLEHSQQPPGDRWSAQNLHYDLGSFVLLRITNDPESKNARAIASNLRASISYCDKEWRELFPSIAGAWGDPDHERQNGAIGDLYEDRELFLKPLEFSHLGIALRYPWGKELECYALNQSSRRYPNWLHPELRLSDETIHIKVIITNNGGRATFYYVLNNLGKENGLRLELTSSPSF